MLKDHCLSCVEGPLVVLFLWTIGGLMLKDHCLSCVKDHWWFCVEGQCWSYVEGPLLVLCLFGRPMLVLC